MANQGGGTPVSPAEKTRPWLGPGPLCGPASLPHTLPQALHNGRLQAPWGPSSGGHRALTPGTLRELPEKQEQLVAIYAVLEHLPEANHNSLERLIFHLVKQVPVPYLPAVWGVGSQRERRRSVLWAGVPWWFPAKA